VLYRAVRRLAGPVAGIAAAGVLAASPAVMVLDRGNIPDTWMILLFVLAADSTVSAIRTGRWSSMVLAGVWVALAFQAKMLEAWLVLPALGLAYLLAGRGDLRARVGRIVVLGAAALVLSLSYMTVVTLVPQSQRPYVDGSSNNSIYHQVFAYNGFGRVGQSPPNVVAEHTLRTPIFGNVESPASADRLLRGGYGRDIGWLLPAAGIALVGILVARRRAPRTDLVRAGAVLWGTWLVVLGILLTFSTAINAYYSAALAPPIAALVAMGSVLAWEHRRRPVVALVAAGTVLVTMAYDAVTIPKAGTGLPSGLTGAAVVLGLAAAGVLGWSAWRQAARSGDGDRSGIGWVLAGATLLLVPIAACVSVVTETLGPFDTPFQPTAATAAIHQMFSAQTSPPGLTTLEAARRGAPYLMAAQTSIVASTYIYATGQEVVPLGGYAGTAPSPSARAIRAMIAAGDFRTALIATPSASASASVIHELCTPAGPPSSQTRFAWTQALKLYDCP
jgi:4-amino-4-deoxy-L-arabinose transferase-like glycosyltransferase